MGQVWKNPDITLRLSDSPLSLKKIFIKELCSFTTLFFKKRLTGKRASYWHSVRVLGVPGKVAKISSIPGRLVTNGRGAFLPYLGIF